jgi:molecular chaperone GrpE
MMNKDRQKPNRIPVRFVDDEGKGQGPRGEADAGGLTPEEIGRESSYEGETEVRRRIDRGTEGPGARSGGEADDADAAGGPDPSELPERREDQDTNPSHRQSDSRARDASAGDADDAEAARNAGDLGGPQLAELIATRAELKRVQSELVRLMSERGELVDKFARRQADFDNYRKRVERERTETYNRATGEVVGQLLPVIDNLRRALDAEASVQAGESKEFRHFLQGVELINKQLNGVLESLGVKPVPTVGQPFDPHVHEAVAAESSDRHEPDTVIEELTRGYRLGDRLIRPAQVKVAK